MDIKEEMLQVGERIRVYRRRMKLTQTELGNLAGHSMNGIAKIEQGNSDPKLSSLLKIAEAMGINVENLVGDRLAVAHESGDLSELTDLGVLVPEEGTKELVVEQLHPGVSRERIQEATGWELRFSDTVSETEEPTDSELSVLRNLIARTESARAR